MQGTKFIPIDEFCVHHDIEVSFISSLQKTGLIEITAMDEARYLEAGQLLQLEKFVRLYYDLDINLEGIETITHLLQRVTTLQEEITLLKNRLRLYEENE